MTEKVPIISTSGSSSSNLQVGSGEIGWKTSAYIVLLLALITGDDGSKTVVSAIVCYCKGAKDVLITLAIKLILLSRWCL